MDQQSKRRKMYETLIGALKTSFCVRNFSTVHSTPRGVAEIYKFPQKSAFNVTPPTLSELF